MSIVKRIRKGLRYILTGKPVKYVKAEISCLMPDGRLAGKKIFVTGGSRGIGRAMAEKFVKEGAEVMISGRNEEVLKEVSSYIGCSYVVADMNDTDSFDALIAGVSDKLGGLDVLVNNAGISLHEGNFRNVTKDGFDMQISVNLRGPYFLSRSFVGYLENEGRSHASILFVSSERGEYVDDLPYGLTKNAVGCLVKGLAKRLTDRGIRVNAVAPGVTATEMTGFSPDDNLYVGYNVNERVYLPEEVAETACFLISDASGCMSGQILVCNEGKSINAHWKQ